MVNPTRHAIESLFVGAALQDGHRRSTDADRRRKPHYRYPVVALIYADATATEAWLCLSMLTLAVMQLLPFFHVFSVVAQMAAMAPAPLISLWLGGLGATRLFALAYDRRWLRFWIAIISLFTWSALLYVSFIIQWRGSISLLLAMFACQSLWVLMRLKSPDAAQTK